MNQDLANLKSSHPDGAVRSQFAPTKSRLFLLVIACIALTMQAGCACEPGDFWQFRTPIFNLGLDQGSHLSAFARSQISGETDRVYTFQDGKEVGRQYAKKHNITEQLAIDDPLPELLKVADLGEEFEQGCRIGINEIALKSLKTGKDIIAGAGIGSTDDSTTQTAEPGNLYQQSVNNWAADRDISNAIVDNTTTSRTNSAGQNPESKSITSQHWRPIDFEFSEDIVIKRLLPLDRERLQLPTKSFNKQMVGNVVMQSGSIIPGRTEQPGTGNLELNDYNNRLFEQSDAIAAPIARADRATGSRQQNDDLPKTIKLIAKPVFDTSPEEKNSSRILKYFESENTRGNQIPSQPDAVPVVESRPVTAGSSSSTAEKEATSVLVDQLDNLQIDLNPVHPLNSGFESKVKSAKPEKLIATPGASAASILESSPVPAETARPGNGGAIRSRQPDKGPVETDLSPNSTGPKLPMTPASYRLPATGPNLQEMLKSPFKRNDETPRTEDRKPRQAGPEQHKVLR